MQKHTQQIKRILAGGLATLLLVVGLVLHFWTSFSTTLTLSAVGLIYLFIGNLFLTDALGKWNSRNQWTYRYGNIMQGIGFILSLIGLMYGSVRFEHPLKIVMTSDWVTAWSTLALTVITMVGVGYAILQYSLGKHEREEKGRPYIYVELEPVNNNLSFLNLVIRNNGAGAAANIKIEFNPNIALRDSSSTVINDMKIMQNMKFLGPGKDVRFFFGSLYGDKTKNPICQEFKIKITYTNTKGTPYASEQILDPTDYLDLVRLETKGLHDIGKSLEMIAESLKKSGSVQEKLYDELESGLILRNQGIQELSKEELINVLKNIVKYGDQYEVMGSSRQEIKAIVRTLREKYFTKLNLSDEDRDIVTDLTKMIVDRQQSGDDGFEETLKKLANK